MSFAYCASNEFLLCPIRGIQPSTKLDLFQCVSLTWKNDHILSAVAYCFSASIGNTPLGVVFGCQNNWGVLLLFLGRDRAHKKVIQCQVLHHTELSPPKCQKHAFEKHSLLWLRNETFSSECHNRKKSYIMKSN